MNAMVDIDHLDLDRLDRDQLRQLACQQHHYIQEKNQQHNQLVAQQTQSLAQKKSELKRQAARIERLEVLLRRMNQKRIGSSSEKHSGQIELQLFNEAELAVLEASLPEEPRDNGNETVAVPVYKRK